MESFFHILTVLVFAIGTGLIAYTLLLGASNAIEKELFNGNSKMAKDSKENVDFFFTKKI